MDPLDVADCLESSMAMTESCEPVEQNGSGCQVVARKSVAHRFNPHTTDETTPNAKLSWRDESVAVEETLAELILARNWNKARQRLASEEHEHEIHKQIPVWHSSQDASHALPLHLACSLRELPPVSFIRFLLKLHPKAAQIREKTWDMLPIHFAVNLSHSNEQVFDLVESDEESVTATKVLEAKERAIFNQRCIVASLIDVFPESLLVTENFGGMLPIHIAASTVSTYVSLLTVSILELLIQKSPTSVHVMDDSGETPRDIAWRNTTFNCFRCRLGGRYVAADHGRCPHVAQPPASGSDANINPLLRLDIEFDLQDNKHGDDIKTLFSAGGITDTTAMTDDSHQHLSLINSSSDGSSYNVSSITSNESLQAEDHKDTTIRLVTNNDWSVSMQVRLESLHSGRKSRWSAKKLRHKPPNPFFEVSILQNESSTTGQTIYRSYPQMRTKDATWERIQDLDVKLDSPKTLRFRITVFDCDLKGGKHLLIGASDVHVTDLARQTARLIPIQRGNKVKGFLRLVHFQLDSVA